MCEEKQDQAYLIERFRTDFGEVHAVAVEPGDGEREWKIGLAFCSPEDRGLPRKQRNKRGERIALRKANSNPVASADLGVLPKIETSTVKESRDWHLNAHKIIRKTVNAIVCEALSDIDAGNYEGAAECLKVECYRPADRVGYLFKWMGGKFSTQWIDRFAS